MLAPASVQDITVVIPTRDVAHWLPDCLDAVLSNGPAAVIVVDGLSSDNTREIAAGRGATVLSDEGRGVAAARLLGARAASTRYVAVVDADVRLTPTTLADLLEELQRDGYGGLQAGLRSVSDGGYWGEALAAHHRSSRSRSWFCLVATLFERQTLLQHGLDETFLSGEDVDLRWRLRKVAVKAGVSRQTVVEHRFGSGWDFAKGQWLADGRAGGRMLGSHGLRSAWFLLLPLLATARGSLLSIVRLQPQWLPYYLCYGLFNYVGMVQHLLERARWRLRPAPAAL